MQHKLFHNDAHPTQDLAISSLLEIDLRDSQELPNWTDQKKLIQLGNKQRLKHPTRIQPVKQKMVAKNNYKKNDDSPPLKRSYNPEMLQNNKTEQNVEDEVGKGENQNKYRENKQKKFNEGEYWSSKVNWISQGTRQQVRSQPKLSKKFSFGYEVNFRQTCRGNNRYESQEKNKQQKYKTSLIYSILSGETEAMRFRYLEQKSQMISSRSYESTPSSNVNKKQGYKLDSKIKGQSCNSNISKNLHESMRKTLKKINARNYQEGPIFNHNSNNKPSEMERAALVRQMLQNIELAKDKTLVSEPKPEKKELKLDPKQQQTVQDIMQPFVYRTEEVKRKSKVLNLNLQAEKIYKGKTVTRWNGRRIIQVLKIQ